MRPEQDQDQRGSPIRALLQPHVVVYITGVLILAGVLLGADAALMMLAGAVVTASALAMAGTFRLTTRWLRFSLRTALIVVTLLCLALGWVIDEVRDRRVAVATIEKLGGTARFGRQPPTASMSISERLLWRVLGEEYMAPVDDVSLVRADITDADLASVGRITGLRRLDLDYSPIGDAGIRRLGALQNLTWLDVEDTNVGDDALASIGKLAALESLILDQTNVGDTGLRSLRAAPKLSYLRLQKTPITDAGLAHLAEVKTLKSLDLRGTRVTPEGVANFRRMLPGCNVRWDDPQAAP